MARRAADDPTEKRTMTAVRLPPADLAEIRRRADERSMTLTEYIRQSALGILPTDDLAVRVEALEREVVRLAQATFGG